jgi:multiple sugar transport system permease protein
MIDAGKQKAKRIPFRKGNRLTKRISTLTAYFVLFIAVLGVVLPLIWVFLTSLKEKSLVYQIPPAWFFTPTWENYLALFQKYPFPKYFLNSTIVAGFTTILGLVIGGVAAYSMTRFDTGGNFLKGWVLNNRTMPPIVVLIPMFMLASQFGLINNYLSLILAYLSFLLPFSIWMLISFFEAIPTDMEEAALVDGATRLQGLFYITIPLAAPGIAATGILSFLFSWNEFMFALVLTGNETRTLPIGVANFLTQRGVEMGELTAATMVMIIPVMILAFSIRGYLVRGLSFGGVK